MVAVIGAGFSGLLTSLHLLARPDGPQVRLVERGGVFGRGRPYTAGLLTPGAFSEVISVPDIGVQAAEVAGAVLHHLPAHAPA